MTRDEAIEIWRRTYADIDASPVDVSGKAVDGFVKLGMLKLDEPAIDQRVHKVLRGGGSAFTAGWLTAALDRAGLMIIEK